MEQEKQYCKEHCPKCANNGKNDDACEIVRTLDGSYRCRGFQDLTN